MKILLTLFFLVVLTHADLEKALETQSLPEFKQLQNSWLKNELKDQDIKLLEEALKTNKERTESLLRSRFRLANGYFTGESVQVTNYNYTEIYEYLVRSENTTNQISNLVNWLFRQSRPEAYLLFDKLKDGSVDNRQEINILESELKNWRVMQLGNDKAEKWQELKGKINSLPDQEIREIYLYHTLKTLNRRSELEEYPREYKAKIDLKIEKEQQINRDKKMMLPDPEKVEKHKAQGGQITEQESTSEETQPNAFPWGILGILGFIVVLGFMLLKGKSK